MKRITTAILLFSTLLKAQEIQNLSLFDCQKLARENHPYYQNNSKIEANSILKEKNIINQWLPQFNANGQATYQSDVTKIPMVDLSRDQYKFWLDFNQMLYDGGSISAQKKVTWASAQSDIMLNEANLHSITEQINQVYFNLLIINENIRFLQNVKNTLLERLNAVQASVKNGALQESDLNNIKIEILKNQQQTDELNISYNSAILVLSELIGKNINDSMNIELPVINFTDTGSYQRAELKAIYAQKTSLGFSDRLSVSQRLPRLYAFTQAGYGRPGLNMLSNDFESYYIIGLNFKWNIWDWNKTTHDRQSVKIQKEMLDSKKQATERNLKIALENSKARIQQLERSLQTDSAIVVLRSEVTKYSAVKLEQGVITSTDYINDLNAEIQSQIQQQTHKIQIVQEKVNYLTIKGVF